RSGVAEGQQPHPRADGGTSGDDRDGLHQFDRAPWADHLDPDVAFVERELAEDVEAEAGDGEFAATAATVEVDGVRDQPAERAEVLLRRIPRAAGVRGGLVPLLVDAFVVAAAAHPADPSLLGDRRSA